MRNERARQGKSGSDHVFSAETGFDESAGNRNGGPERHAKENVWGRVRTLKDRRESARDLIARKGERERLRKDRRKERLE